MIAVLNRLHRDEGAQGLAFAAMVLFVLVAFLVAAVDLGAVVEARVAQQGAADAAAYSGVIIRAEGLSAIAAMNHVLIWAARAALAMVASVVTLGVLVALNAVFPGAFAWAVPLFSQAVSTAVEWIPRLRKWSDRLARAEDRLARIVPLLAAAELDRIARADGAARGLPFPPASALPVSAEKNRARYASRVTGGLVPAWALGWLGGGGSGGGFSQTHSASENVDGVLRTRSVTKSDGNIGEGVQDPATRRNVSRFKRLMAEYAKNPWPMPRVLDRRYDAEALTAAAFPPKEAFRPLIWPEFFAEPKAFPFLATARPLNPGLSRPGAEAAADNLYLMDGWLGELIPVDLGALKTLGTWIGKEHLPGLEH